MVKIANAMERSNLHHRLVYSAVKAANSENVSEIEHCFDILRYLKNMKLSVNEISHSEAIHVLESMRHHTNPKIRTEVEVVFESWRNTLFSGGRDSTTCNKALPVLMKKKPLQRSQDIVAESKKKTEFWGLKKNQDQRSKTHGVDEIKQNLNKADDCNSFAATPIIQTKKQPALPLKRSENPRSKAHELGVIKQNLKKSGVYKSVRPTSRPLQMKKQPPLQVSQYCPKKNTAEMLELFEIAKKSADVANAKGILAAKAETCICVETLSLLINYPICSTAKETRLVMEKLQRLTKHKDRKTCNSASTLLQHWTQSIRNQQP